MQKLFGTTKITQEKKIIDTYKLIMVLIDYDSTAVSEHSLNFGYTFDFVILIFTKNIYMYETFMSSYV